MPRPAPTQRRPRASLGEAAFVVAFALLGYVVGHDLSYELLAAIGVPIDVHGVEHGYLGILRHLAPLLLVGSWLVVLAVAVRGVRPRLGALLTGPRAVPIACLAPSLAFAAAEFAERIDAEHVVPLPLLLAGALVQACIGLVVLFALRFAFRVADVVAVHAAGRRWRMRRELERPLPARDEAWRSRFAGSRLSVRGPPLRNSIPERSS